MSFRDLVSLLCKMRVTTPFSFSSTMVNERVHIECLAQDLMLGQVPGGSYLIPNNDYSRTLKLTGSGITCSVFPKSPHVPVS